MPRAVGVPVTRALDHVGLVLTTDPGDDDMIVDLHAHYPMHLKESSRTSPPRRRESPGDVIRELVLTLANRVANFPDSKRPAVTIDNLRAGEVMVALSVLYLPFNEMDFSKPYGAPPASDYFEDLLSLIDAVEKSIQERPQKDAVTARDLAELQAGIEARKVVLIHALEGGFHVGDSKEAIRDNVRELRRRGVGYITLAHLFFRGIATNAPALPFMKDELYDTIFPQEEFADVTDLGEALLEAMVEEHILIDITHMSDRGIARTFEVLDRLDPEKKVPVIASHSACRHGPADYNISDDQLRAVAERNGVVGLIACNHWMADGLNEPRTFAESLQLFDRHVDRIRQVTRSDDVAAIGTDIDGFIKPAMPGFESPANFRDIEKHIRQRYPQVAAKLCSENALRVLQYWGQR
ncbi:MAG: dipeptidase [Longimicrobiales bacterium]